MVDAMKCNLANTMGSTDGYALNEVVNKSAHKLNYITLITRSSG